jgi:hypothetical protein
MPAHAPVTLANTYTLIVEMFNTANPQLKWRNSFDFQSTGVPTIAGSPLCQSIKTFMGAMVNADTTIGKFALYNWAKGTQPYPTGLPIDVFYWNVPGAAPATWATALFTPYSPVGGEIALRMDHEPVTPGKPGRTFFRGLLGEGDIKALTGGQWVLTVLIAILQAILDNLLAATHVNTFFGAGSGGEKLVIVRYSPKTGVVHGASSVSSWRLMGATTNKRTRKNPR